MIEKKVKWSNLDEINKYTGIDIEATKDDKDENLEITKVRSQEIIKIKPKLIFRANKIPT